MEKLNKLIERGDAEVAEAWVRELLQAGTDPEVLLREAMIPAMGMVGNLFQAGEYYLPQILMGARAMPAGMEVLKPALVQHGTGFLGKVVMETVQGDIHDIGKNLVTMTPQGAAFEVVASGWTCPPKASWMPYESISLWYWACPRSSPPPCSP